MAAKSDAKPDKLMAYLRLFRIPNVFTAISDVAMGFIVVQQSLFPVAPFVGLALATALMYTAGMVLNDVADYEIDKQERPKRPLPAGEIEVEHARNLGYGMLGVGVLVAFLAGWLPGSAAPMPWRSGVMAVLLAVSIIAYNASLKATVAGPLVMGSCRFWNVLMGMGLAHTINPDDSSLFGYAPFQLLIAGSIGIYIVGVTVFSRQEVEKGSSVPLAFGLLLVSAGLAGMAFYGELAPMDWMKVRSEVRVLLIAAIGFSVVRRCFIAVRRPVPRNVRIAIKHCLLSLIVLDAAVAAQVAGAGWGAAILILLAPAILLGRWVYST